MYLVYIYLGEHGIGTTAYSTVVIFNKLSHAQTIRRINQTQEPSAEIPVGKWGS